MTHLRTLVGFALLALPLAGCKQGIGDRCQVSDDCASDLVCIIPSGTSLAEGGSCQATGTVGDAGVADMAMQITGDAAAADMVALPDLASGADLAGVDLTTLPDLTPAPDQVLPDLVSLPDLVPTG